MPERLLDYWLVVEDDESDFSLFEMACSESLPQTIVVHREADGLGAQQYLNTTAVKPSLIVSDLKMAGMDGFELLKWVRSTPGIGDLPFVVFSCSGLRSDRDEAQRLGADDYKVKPTLFTDLGGILQKWVELAQSRKHQRSS